MPGEPNRSTRRSVQPARSLDRLIDLGLRAIVEPALWRSWTDEAVRLFGSRGGQFWVLDRAQGAFSRSYFSFNGQDGDALASAYFSGWDRLDPNRAAIAAATLSGVLDDGNVALHDPAAARFQKWRAAMLGASRSLTACVLLSDKLAAGITLFWSDDQGPPTLLARQQLEEILPSLIQSLTLSLRHADAVDEALWEALSYQPDEALLLLDETGRVTRTTPPAEAIAGSGCNFVIRDNQVMALVPADNSALQAAVATALQRPCGTSGSVFLRALAGLKSLIVTVCPIERPQRLIGGYEPAAVVRVMSLDQRHVQPDPRARVTFKLTGREAEVAAFLKCGFSVDEAAASLGMSPETMRVHRRNIYRKLGVDRQAQLVHVLHLV